jgi:poly-gamma-glutamate system protein
VSAATLRAKIIPITSLASSSYGANNPKLTWLDMESILFKEGIIPCRSVAASLGGQEDRALGRSKKGRELLLKAIERNGLNSLGFETTTENIDARMGLYEQYAEGKPVKVYVNVGGGTISVGTVAGKKLFKPGLNRRPPPGVNKIEGVMNRFAREGIPVIHIVYLDQLADRYGLPKSPATMPRVGDGEIFVRVEYNLYLVGINLVILMFLLYILLRSDIGHRIFGSSKIVQTPKHPEPMV